MPTYTTTSTSDPSDLTSVTETTHTETTRSRFGGISDMLNFRGGSSSSGTKRKIVGKRYRWPEIALAITLFSFFVCGVTTMGIFAYFTWVQNKMFVAIPWYFYFLIVTGILTMLYSFGLVLAYYGHSLLPLPVMVTAFILFVLWLTGLVKMSIELWGPMGSINDNCTRYVYTDRPWGGRNIDTLARIQQIGVCNMWKTAFALEMIATFLLLYLLFISYQVNARASRR